MAKIDGKHLFFEAGETVRWNPAMEFPGGFFPAYPNELTTSFGPGPFRVMEVTSVPSQQCACNGSVPKGWSAPHSYDCPAYGPWSVGHSQWVKVKTPLGPAIFSGKYFLTQFVDGDIPTGAL